jgi:PAN-like domain
MEFASMKRTCVAAIVAVIAFGSSSFAQQAAQPAPAPDNAPRMERLSGVWVEGPGFNITYGGNYDACAQKCLGTPQCVMIEYYRPEKKCNMYDKLRPRVKGGSSDVALRK